MRIFGKFADVRGKIVSVDILTNGDKVYKYGERSVEDDLAHAESDALGIGESSFKAIAKRKTSLMFPRFKEAITEMSDLIEDIDTTGGGGGAPSPSPQDPTPHDNIDASVEPEYVPDSSLDNGQQTDVEEGRTWYGEDADYTIGEDGIWFAGSPFEITSEIEDNFEAIIKQTAVLRLVTSKYLGHLLFSSKMRKSRIVVKREGDTLFDGYLTMNVYNQPFNTEADQFEIQCVDKLATINYFNYKNTFPETYKSYSGNATVVSFKDVLLDALSGLDGNIWYDCSKSIDGERWSSVFEDIGIGENVFFGDDFDGMMNREDTLTQILQYLNLHIIQHKEDFYIFDWNSIKTGNTTWLCLTNSDKQDTFGGSAKILTGDMHMAMDTDITIADVYSQVQVTCDVDEAEEILADLFDSDDLKSNYNNMQKYVTEYISEGNGTSARDCMLDMIDGKSNTYDAGTMTDWYVQAMYNPKWQLNVGKPLPEPTVSEGGRYVNQQEEMNNVKKSSLSAGLFRIAKLERKATELANTDPVPKLDTKDYLYISVNGNEQRDSRLTKPSDSDIEAVEPIIVYTGNTATGAFSPVDHDTTNYLLFEGKIELQPIQKESSKINAGISFYNAIPSKNNEKGRFYVRKWYRYFDCQQAEADDEGWSDINSMGYIARRGHILGAGLMMPAEDKSLDMEIIDEHEDAFRYSFSAEGDPTDQIRKVPVLECYLKIGDKLLVEYNFKKDGSSDFGWFTEDNLPDKVINGNYTGTKASTFTLGFNPAIDDMIVGTSFDIQNTVSFTMNIDGKGTAVPIKKEDALSGDIEFKILGPCALTWNQIIRIHPSFWRHTKWEQDSLPILAFIENIILSDFSIKVVSDNALSNDEGDGNDLMYVAKETDYNFNNKHETDFSIITQLDSATAKAKGIKNGIYLNAAVNMTNSEPLACLHTKKEGKKKAEEHYVYDYLEDWRKSRITLTMSVRDDGIDFRNRYGSVPLKKSFNILGISRNIKQCYATLMMREYADGLKDFE